MTVERPLRLKGIEPDKAYTANEIKDLKSNGDRDETAGRVPPPVPALPTPQPELALDPLARLLRQRAARVAALAAGPSSARDAGIPAP